MSYDAHANLAYSTVATAPSPASSGTSLVVAAGQGSRFPAAPFNALVWPVGTIATPANAEIVRVTVVSTDTLTITRAQESTSARSVIVGDQIAATATAKTFTDIETLGWNNTRRAKTGNYTLQNADRATTLALGGSTLFTLTVNAASGYDADFAVRIVNEDTGRAKKLSINGLSDFFLWPGQDCVLYNQNNAWQTSRQTRWRLTGATTVYVDQTNGNAANDGLASGAGNALASIQSAYDLIVTNFDLGGQVVTIQCASGQTYTTGLSISSSPTGGALVTLDLGTSTLNTTNTNGISVSAPVGLTVRNGTIQTTTWGECLNVSGAGGVCTVGSGITFGAAAGGVPHVVSQSGGLVLFTANYTITGGASAHWQANATGGISASSITVTLTGTPAFSQFVYCDTLGYISAYSITYSGSATGARYSVSQNGIILTFGGGANYFPGNSTGSSASGGQYS